MGQSSYIQRFWNICRPSKSKGAVALETGILVVTLHHLAAAAQLGVAMETLRLLLRQRGTMGSGVQVARHLRGGRKEKRGKSGWIIGRGRQ